MPLALEPNETFEIILESDKDKPRESQPRFIYRHLTCRQWRQIARLQDELEQQKNADAVMDKIYGAAITGLIGWVNMTDPQSGPILFDIKKLEDIIGLTEAQELIVKLLNKRPTLVDKKKLDLPSVCDTEASVKNAAESTNAKTGQQ